MKVVTINEDIASLIERMRAEHPGIQEAIVILFDENGDVRINWTRVHAQQMALAGARLLHLSNRDE